MSALPEVRLAGLNANWLTKLVMCALSRQLPFTLSVARGVLAVATRAGLGLWLG